MTQARERKGRSAETRKADETSSMERPAIDEWSPAAVLETPPDKGGYTYRWIRYEVNGSADNRRVPQAMREGYVRVNVSELDDYWLEYCDRDGRYEDNFARSGGLILMKIATERLEKRRAYYARRTDEQKFAVDQLQGVAGKNAVIEDRGSQALEGAAGGHAMQQMSQARGAGG